MPLDSNALKFISDITPLGLLAVCIVLAYLYGRALIQEQRSDRLIKKEVLLSEQTNAHQRDTAMRERERAFFSSISAIYDLAESVSKLVQETARREQSSLSEQARNTQKDEKMIETLTTISAGVTGLNTAYNHIVAGQTEMLNSQLGIFSTFLDDEGLFMSLKIEVQNNNTRLQDTLHILRKTDKSLNDTLKVMARLEAYLIEQTGNESSDIVDIPKDNGQLPPP